MKKYYIEFMAHEVCCGVKLYNEKHINFDMDHIEKVYYGRKYGKEDYIYHLDNVYHEFLNDFISIDIKNAIYYHDALEDTDITETELIEKIGYNAFKIVKILTRQKDEDYFDYINKIKKSGIRECVLIKIADLKANIKEFYKLENPTEYEKKRVKKYEKALEILIM